MKIQYILHQIFILLFLEFFVFSKTKAVLTSHRLSLSDRQLILDAHNNERAAKGSSNMRELVKFFFLFFLFQINFYISSIIYQINRYGMKNQLIWLKLLPIYVSWVMVSQHLIVIIHTLINILDKILMLRKQFSFNEFLIQLPFLFFSIEISRGGSSIDVAAGVADWISEKNDYILSNNSCSSVCGHYTQVVWADSHRIGCSYTTCRPLTPVGWNPGHLMVCNYYPPYVFQKKNGLYREFVISIIYI